MRRGRLLLPWGLLAGLLIWTAAIEGLSIKAPSLLKKPRNVTTNVTTTTSTTTSPASASELTELLDEEEEELDEPSDIVANVTEKSLLTGNPQNDYQYDPNLPRELPPGYNLSSYPFFSRVPNNVDFECGEELLDGYYANVHYKCQVYHHCLSGIRYDFLCANYTAFDQKTFICHFVSEVDCANSAKFWNRNKGLYETPTTSTVKPLTTVRPVTAAPARRPAAGAAGSRRRRPYRRRRPAYDYYYDDEYDDEEYEDEAAPAVQSVGRGVGNRKRPDAPAAAAAEAPSDDKPFKADSSIYDRPRQPPKIRRPVPANEREKYEYTPTKESGDKKNKEDYDKPAERDYDRKRPQDGADYDKPRGQDASQSRARPKQRPIQDDDEYYDEEDYEQPRTTSRKNNQDYYAPSGGDRDFGRRPAMTGVGRPLRRNRPGARRRPADDDYYDDRRPYRASTDDEPRRRPAARDEEHRRRPSVRDEEPRRRPALRDDEPRRRPATSDEEPRRRPATSDEEPRRRPAMSDEEPRRRPAMSDEEPRKRPATSEEEPRKRPAEDDTRRRPAKIEDDMDRRPSSSEEDVRRRPADDEPRRRPAVQEEEVRRRPAAHEEDSRRKLTVSPRKRVPQRDEYERDTIIDRPSSSARDSAARPQSNRDSVSASTGRDSTHDRASERPLTTGREANYERSTSSSKDKFQSSRDHVNDRTTERAKSERPFRTAADIPLSVPTGSGSMQIRPLNSRGQTSRDVVDSDYPIPAAKPAYISTTGRGSYRKRVQEEEEARVPSTGSAAYRGSVKNTPKSTDVPATAPASRPPTTRTTVSVKTTEAPLAYDDEYYDDEEEEGVEDLPTGSGRIGSTGSSQEAVKEELPPPPVIPRKPLTSRGREDAYVDVEEVRGKVDVRGRVEGDRRSEAEARQKETPISSEVDGTGRVVTPPERVQARPIIEPPPVKRPPSSSYHFNGDDVLVETTATRQPFRPKSTTTTSTTPASVSTASFYEKPVAGEAVEQRHNYQSNFRRKSNQASNIESTKVLPSKDELRDIEEVHQPATPHATTETPTPSTVATLRLETEKFDVRKPLDALPPTGKENLHYLKHGAVRFPDEFPRRAVLPDITDPEYDVTLNEAVHPTRLPHNDGTTRIKIKVPIYQYGSNIDPTGSGGHLKRIPTLLSSASQTHIAKAPYPVHDKPLKDEEYDDAPLEDDYEDTAIPTGKGATQATHQDTQIPTGTGAVKYEWTTYPSTALRGSEVSLPPNRAVTGHYILQTNSPRQQQQGFPTPSRGAFEQQPVQPAVRNNNQQQYFKPSNVREPTVYHGGMNPLLFTVGYDYDYRPQRKYVRRGAYDYFGKPY